MIVHQNAKATSIIRMNLDGEKRVLMVDADLKLDGEHPNYSPKESSASNRLANHL
ncbi:hypothetical protein [Bosea sp. ASV33]|uniref:hypothetical protein n=1 Tax=Bosea sp. ASV33 TaxID=2795106 RepID=UPI0018EA9EC4|nr:hypothetical protein [Bosea sp. ASV33]